MQVAGFERRIEQARRSLAYWLDRRAELEDMATSQDHARLARIDRLIAHYRSL